MRARNADIGPRWKTSKHRSGDLAFYRDLAGLALG
ncbi:hypothetical protein X737_16555 [Mesorhizobium sp. L48C026A00]|nr:hypothetical protein X737_16555 [Mesorhizobium sp. L48C026A00]